MKSDFSPQARAKGGRSSGGTRYYCSKFQGEKKMISLMEKAKRTKKTKVELLIEALYIAHKRVEEALGKYGK